MAKDIKVCIGVDIDAVAGWIGSYGGADSPADIQRGMFAGEVGVPRLLKLFKKFGIQTTFFSPATQSRRFLTGSSRSSRPATNSAPTATRTKTRLP
ncbi:peptidoglycan deacetylase [Arthrobacter sp. Hiyo4]|nr:peptidoglycan deacetylase [Arthrobacter sp. Hiyo4]